MCYFLFVGSIDLVHFVIQTFVCLVMLSIPLFDYLLHVLVMMYIVSYCIMIFK